MAGGKASGCRGQGSEESHVHLSMLHKVFRFFFRIFLRFFGATMESKSQQLEDPSDVCKRGRTGEAALCTEENTNDGSNEDTSSDPVLEPKHKIFLSHSGAQKEFVEHLCEALERRYHYPFFDKRPSSLPKGEKFPQLIIQAAQQCEMAVVVVSEEYFMSKWPMVELNAFVQARRQESNKKLQILPLFYGLSVSEFREKERQETWYVQWESFAEDDAQGRIKVHEWKDALGELGSFNGISYNRELKEIVAYENAIVSSICHSIEPDIKWDDSHVQGKSNICKVVCKNIEQVGLSRRYNVKVVGLYGMGGIGKTTLCKILCNELSREYEGRVCHVEFESKGTSSMGLLEKVLMRLTNTSLEVLQRMNEGEYMDILQKTLSRDKTFLAVDNVWDDRQSIKEAKMFLKGPFCKGSLVIVTSRSWRTLELLGVDGDASFEVPDLGLEDAMNLFLYHAAGGKRFVKEEEKRDIFKCLQRCYFQKGDGGGRHYHPLALEALGSQLSCLGDKPSEWVENLWRVKNFSYLSGGNPVFGILRSSFDLLPLCDQSLFMDLVFYRPSNWLLRRSWEIDMKEWLCVVHKLQDEAEIKCRLDSLKRRGLLQDVDLASGEVRMHDLYREFAELEVRGKLDESTDLEKRRWGYVDDGDLSELESSPSVGLSHKLIRLRIEFGCFGYITESLEVINWQYCSNVVVLKLQGIRRWGGGALSLELLKCLKSFSLHHIWGLDRVEGLEGLKYLTYFTWQNSDSRCLGRGERERTQMGRFPASLVVLEIMDVEVLFGPDVLARCTKLRTLKLGFVQAGTLDVSNCSSLQTLEVTEVDDLQTLSGLTARSGLKSLQVFYCRNIPGLEQVAGLEQLVLESSRSMAHLQLDLQKLTKLRAFKIYGESFSSFSLPRQLQELSLESFNPYKVVRPRVIEALKANRLEQLQVLRLYGCDVSGLENVGGWPALRCLDLSYCDSLSRLPDLSQSTNLEELNLRWIEGELCEDDVCMLARLRQLQPVPIGLFRDVDSLGRVRLDLVRRKELKYSSHRLAPSAWVDWKEHEWHETDLGIPPYRFGFQGLKMISGFEEKSGLFEDNAAVVAQVGAGFIKIDRTKHIEPQPQIFTFTQELTSGQLEVQKIESAHNIADFLTKALPGLLDKALLPPCPASWNEAPP